MAKDSSSNQVLRLCDEALQLDDDARESFLNEACAGDPGLRSSVDSVLIAISDSSDFMDSPPPLEKVDLTGQKIGPYTILQEIGEGGMGSVYLGERVGPEFTQTVAIKLVRGQLLAKELIQRFNAERKILASLNHPYIAGLIDGGTTSDGMPYLVMEYVDGLTIDKYCDKNKLSIPDRIKLIQKVAMAVHAAHQNLVVHRDLKPSNVLVTDDGIPKLLDFGIAKLLTPVEEDKNTGNTTVFGRQAMTPNYASPEQVLENRVTTASDVYTLGVLTYRLLTGERPYHIETATHKSMMDSFEALTIPRPSARLDNVSSQQEVLKIAKLRSTTPSRLKKTLTGDLDNILAKALHKEPNRRYSSVANFSEDLDRYLTGMPVQARADSLGYRVARFVGRHKVGVAASIGAAVLLVAGLAGTGWAYLRAEQARSLADQRFDQVRSIANTLMFEVYDDIERVPGTTSARQTLASVAQQYLEALASVPDASTTVQLEAARGYARLVNIFNREAVADPENRELADEALEKTLNLLNQLEETHGDTGEVLRTLGQVKSSQGNRLLSIDNDPEDARSKLQEALMIFEKAEALLPGDLDLLASRFSAQKKTSRTVSNGKTTLTRRSRYLTISFQRLSRSENVHPITWN
ncbi:MAG: serine/threonine-protein kinase [Pseudomonadota bacterium]